MNIDSPILMGTVIASTLPVCIQFTDADNEVVGKLFINDGQLQYEGDASESATSFLQFMQPLIRQAISKAIEAEAHDTQINELFSREWYEKHAHIDDTNVGAGILAHDTLIHSKEE